MKQWNHGTDAIKRFEEIKNKFEGSNKYILTLEIEDVKDLIQMVDLLIKAKQIKIEQFYDESKDYEIESLKFKNEELCKQINNYRYFPERLKEEIIMLEDFINTFKFINNRECYTYKVAKEKLDLLKQILNERRWRKCLK